MFLCLLDFLLVLLFHLSLSQLDSLVFANEECSEDLLLDTLVASDSSISSCDCSLVLWDPLVLVWSHVSDAGKETSAVTTLDAAGHLALVLDCHVAAGCLDDSDGV